MLGKIITAGLFCVVAGSATARPVSYQGGWTLITENDRQTSSALIHYTPDPKFSVGVKTAWDRDLDIQFTGVQGTWLTKRWFDPDFQGNLYVFGAVGIAEGVESNTGSAGLGSQLGVMADWETRRVFLGYRAHAHDYDGLDASAMQAVKVGWAPYAGDTGQLHTWFMIEVDHRPDADNPVDVTPLLRLFKGPALFEIGYSLEDQDAQINLQYRF